MSIRNIPLWEGTMPGGDPAVPCENRMTAYFLDDGLVHPAVVIYPGGAYTHYGATEQIPIAEFYNSQGFHAFICYYRVFPYHHPAPLLDAQRAVKLVRYHAADWKVNPDKVFTIGFSAGGHLCGCVATMADRHPLPGDPVDDMECRPTGAVLGYAVTSAKPEDGHEWSFRQLLGDAFEAMREELSLENCVTEDTCPCFLWSTMKDDCVPVYHTLEFTRALRAKNIPAEVHIFPFGAHGIGVAADVEGLNTWPMLTVAWIRRCFG